MWTGTYSRDLCLACFNVLLLAKIKIRHKINIRWKTSEIFFWSEGSSLCSILPVTTTYLHYCLDAHWHWNYSNKQYILSKCTTVCCDLCDWFSEMCNMTHPFTYASTVTVMKYVFYLFVNCFCFLLLFLLLCTCKISY